MMIDFLLKSQSELKITEASGIGQEYYWNLTVHSDYSGGPKNKCITVLCDDSINSALNIQACKLCLCITWCLS
jgi:hypothetical protein